ncbi:NAD(P)/FAD-dependent oxidoreductase [Candidatus Falkowbacteria bacterium]|nr:NAD(P)/FAD-dependent oxidoreductase [Candidatus Falkowbacteria bacterium]
MNQANPFMTDVSQKFDVVVIGGGPAGMMAAGRAGELGARVLLLEKNARLGAKLLMTGHGRCNLTNKLPVKEFVRAVGPKGSFLFSSLSSFGPEEMINFLTERRLRVRVEDKNRVFPASNRATDVLLVLTEYMRANRVEIRYDAEVSKMVKDDNSIRGVILKSGEEISADNFIIATGGKSYPVTGSNGDGYAWSKFLGHSLAKARPGLTAINLSSHFIKELEGLSLDEVKASLRINSKEVAAKIGDCIFTSNGVSGPLAHDLSRQVPADLNSTCALLLDLKPEMGSADLNGLLQKYFHEAGNKQLKNGLQTILPPKIVPIVLNVAEIVGEKLQNSILKEERQAIADTIKSLEFKVAGLAGFDKANITVGGVSLEEIDPKTMQSKIVPNAYFAGEIIDLDGPTGGFNLQICWSTGFAAGSAAARKQ